MSILIGSDIVPTKNKYSCFIQSDMDTLLGDPLLKLLSRADYRIFNLEVPLTDCGIPILKSGPCLCAPTASINGLSAIHTDLVSIANNHIMDYGANGLESTIALLNKNNIKHVGAGNNLVEAKAPFIFAIKGKKVGVFSCCEHEFSIATENTAGANPYDPLETFDAISNLKCNCQYVIMLYHGGKEHYRYPSPLLQRRCRKFVEKGADLVICQHSHCIGCEEKYKNGTIVYGQGNFLFDLKNDECWQTGLLILITDNWEIEYIPLRKKGAYVRLARETDAEEILASFETRSRSIAQQGFIQKEYKRLADDMQSYYLQQFRGIKNTNIIMRLFNKITRKKFRDWLMTRLYDDSQKRSIQNCLQCEAHRELILMGIKEDNDDFCKRRLR